MQRGAAHQRRVGLQQRGAETIEPRTQSLDELRELGAGRVLWCAPREAPSIVDNLNASPNVVAVRFEGAP